VHGVAWLRRRLAARTDVAGAVGAPMDEAVQRSASAQALVDRMLHAARDRQVNTHG